MSCVEFFSTTSVSVAQQPKSGQERLIFFKVYKSHSIKNSSDRSISLSQRPLPMQLTNKHKWSTSMLSAGFEPAIPAFKRLQN